MHIVGAPGSGTSTLAAAIASCTRIHHLEVDDFLWLPTRPSYQNERPRVWRIMALTEALTHTDNWVLAGSMGGWGECLVPLFSLVVFLSTPTQTRLARLRRREIRRFGIEAISRGGTMYSRHKDFMRMAASYDAGNLAGRRSRARHQSWIENVPCPVLSLDGSLPVSVLLDRIAAAKPQ